ncbi:hypothetical protein BD414DRAFT_535010 [Trametes punicea]|nr:hypothetical protein BD414DRAFT_535010 [Trametes punicea]
MSDNHRDRSSKLSGLKLPVGRSKDDDKIGKRDVANGLIAALKITKEAAAAFPPLQSAAGGLLAIVEHCQKLSSNQEGLNRLEEYINKLNKLLPEWSQSSSDHGSCHTAFKGSLIEFDSQVKEVAKDVKRLRSHRWFKQAFNAAETADQIDACLKSLSWLVQCLNVRGVIAIELTIQDLNEGMRNGLQHIEKKIDGVSEEVHGLSNKLHQLGTNTVPGLRYSLEARFDYHQGGRSECEPGTRSEILATIYAWLRPDDPRLSNLPPPLVALHPEKTVLWIKGLAGTGKSTLAQTVATWCDKDGLLGASFFCARSGDRSNIQLIIPTIAHQLAARSPTFHDVLSESVKADPYINVSLLPRQLEKLIVEPLRASKAGGFLAPCVVILDALDECEDDEVVSVVLKALSSYVSDLAPLKFIVTSRPVENILSGFRLQ